MICVACQGGHHIACEPVADLERECTFVDCSCLCNPEHIARQERARAYVADARVALDKDDDRAAVNLLHKAIALLQPAPARPLRRMGLAVVKPSYAQASGEPVVPEWMETKR